jgi:hypothetical protein
MFLCLLGNDKFDVHRAMQSNMFPKQNEQDAPLSQIYLFLD